MWLAWIVRGPTSKCLIDFAPPRLERPNAGVGGCFVINGSYAACAAEVEEHLLGSQEYDLILILGTTY